VTVVPVSVCAVVTIIDEHGQALGDIGVVKHRGDFTVRKLILLTMMVSGVVLTEVVKY